MACVESSKSGTSLENILDCIEALLEYRIDVKWCDRKRRTALMLACQQGFPEVVKLLLPLSRLDGEDNEGRTVNILNHLKIIVKLQVAVFYI